MSRIRIAVAATAVALATVPFAGAANATIPCYDKITCAARAKFCQATTVTYRLCSVSE